MNVSLNGYRVLVTRPGTQGIDLGRQIEEQGGVVIVFPTIEIKPMPGLNRDQLINDLSWSSYVIFISRNAVTFCYELVPELNDILAEKKVFATGAGTSNVLQNNGIAEVYHPPGEAGSEGLLAAPEFSEPEVQGKHVLIIRGNGGREMLRKTIESRNALVKYANVYSRHIPDISPGSAESIWQQKIPDIIVVTSVEALQNLVELTAQKFRDLLFSRKLVVMSKRIADHAADLGFTGSPVVAQEQSNDGLMLAIHNCVEHLNEH